MEISEWPSQKKKKKGLKHNMLQRATRHYRINKNRKIMHEQNENINKDIKTIKIFKQKFWNWRTELKNWLEGFNNGHNQTVERLC